MSPATDDEIDDAIRKAATSDYLDVWYITTGAVHAVVNEDIEAPYPVEPALAAIARLLRRGDLVVGRLEPPGEFVATDEDVEAAIERIGRETRALDRDLRPGDIAWFSEPEPISR